MCESFDAPEIADDPQADEKDVPASNSRLIKSDSPQWINVASLVSLLVCVLVYVLRLDRVVGLFVDDGWYVLLAKSLATGQGYSLINSPSAGILPLYPPAFPFTLSLLYRLWPQFPENVTLLKSLSVLAMIGVGLLAYRYFTRDRNLPPYVSLAIAVATVLSPPLVFLATSTLMSECFFAFVLMLTMVVVERSVKAGHSAKGLQLALLAAALCSVGFLTRSVAIGLLMAVFLYFLKERLLKSAIAFVILAAMICGSWMLYTRAHTPTPEQQKEQGGHIVLPYTVQFWQARAGFVESGTIGVSDLPKRVFRNFVEIAGRDIGRIMVTPLFEALRDPFKEAQTEKVQSGGSGQFWFPSFILSLFVIAGFIAAARTRITLAEIAVPILLLITMLWPWETFRFVLPLLPFVVFYFALGARELYRWHLRLRKTSDSGGQWGFVGIAAALVAAINLYGNVNYLSRSLVASPIDQPQWLQTFNEAESLLKWVDQGTPKDAVLATSNPPLVNLYTGRKTVALEDAAANWQNWNRLGVRYLVHVSVYPTPLDPAENKYRSVYRSRGGTNFRVTDLGDPSSRPPW